MGNEETRVWVIAKNDGAMFATPLLLKNRRHPIWISIKSYGL